MIHGNAHHLTNDPAICDEVIEVWEELRSTWAQLALAAAPPAGGDGPNRWPGTRPP